MNKFVYILPLIFIISCSEEPNIVEEPNFYTMDELEEIANRSAEILNLSFQCEEPLPEFTLGPYSNPSKDEIKRLCSCIWNQFPENGWERRVSEQLANREDPGSPLAGFPNRFGNAIAQCGGGNL